MSEITYYPKDYVGQHLKRIRLEQGLTQTELAKKVGVHRVQIAKYESGTDQMSISRLLIIAYALQIPPGRFFE